MTKAAAYDAAALLVFVRATIVGHLAFDFWGVALAFTALFVLAARGIARQTSQLRHETR